MTALAGVDQLRGDTHPTARLAHASFEDISHAQLGRHVADIDGLALIGKR